MSGGIIEQLGLHNTNVMVEQIIEGLHHRVTENLPSDQATEQQMTNQLEHMASVAHQNEGILNTVQDLIKKVHILE